MARLLTFLTLVAFAAAQFNDDSFVNDPKIHAEINRWNNTWVAGPNARFTNWTYKQAKNLCGTVLEDGENDVTVNAWTAPEGFVAPESFNSLEQWPKSIHPIRDQEQCGSCWAFSASEVLSDRFAISTDNAVDVVLSPEDMVSCDHLDMGCNGGRLTTAWMYMKYTGLVKDSCFPYTAGAGEPAKCVSKCVDGEEFTKYKAKNFASLRTVADMQANIMEFGPIQAGFSVYKSFMSYKSGVYHKGTFEFIPEGGHAIKIVGWGVEDNTPYWLVANSWNTNWGMDGYFKIRRGNNECGIEDQVVAGEAGSPPSTTFKSGLSLK